MIKEIKLLCLCTLAFMLPACTNEENTGGGGGDTVAFRIVPTIAEGGAGDIALTENRALVDGAFPPGAAIGLGISAPAASPALSDFYTNFYGLYNGAVWYYYLNNINIGDRLSGFARWKDIALYGYYPYNANATDLSAIPFRLASLTGADEAEGFDTDALTDHLVAGSQSMQMDAVPPDGAVSLKFKHLMTAIELKVNRPHISTPILKVKNITCEISGGRKLIAAGTYSAVCPDIAAPANNITPVTEVSKMTIEHLSGVNIITASTTHLLIVMPELRHNDLAGFEDASVTLTFRFTDQDGSTYLFDNFQGGHPSVSFRLSDITNDGAADRGLLAGYRYAVTAILGTYTHFSAPTTGTPLPPTVIEKPLEDDTNPDHIDI